MQYKIIVAVCKDNGIGYKNTMPWKIKEDLRHFSKLTKGNGKNALIMGRNTWESLGKKPLPLRDHYILSSTLEQNCDVSGVYICKNINEVDAVWGENPYENVWIIGGSTIYRQFLEKNRVDECIITYIDADYECDTFFPELLPSEWKLVDSKSMENSAGIDITVKQYKKY